jgi:parallel beta-helix repeat protein
MFTVVNTADSGPGSLREAIIAANMHPGPDRIRFNIPGAGPRTIQLLNALPAVSEKIVIDGTTQHGYAALPLIVLDGSMSNDPDGLTVMADYSTVRGLAIDNFFGAGLHIVGSHDTVSGSFVGTDSTGTAAAGNLAGILIEGGFNDIDDNLVSGNFGVGVFLAGDHNILAGNRIGTDVTGTQALPNGTGVAVEGQFNQIGIPGDTDAGSEQANLISGNRSAGVLIAGQHNLVANNSIGTDVTGALPLGNEIGIWATGSSNDVRGNVISANRFDGVRLSGDENSVISNRIGTDVDARVALGNNVGVFVEGMANQIGRGNGGPPGNIISGNAVAGIVIMGASLPAAVRAAAPVAEPFNDVVGNLIGTNAEGTGVLGNQGIGVWVMGGPASIRDNLVSANGEGIRIDGDDNTITNNLVGTDISGRHPLGNGMPGAVGSGREEEFRAIAVTGTEPVLLGGRIRLRTVLVLTFESEIVARLPPDLRPQGNGITISGGGNVVGGAPDLANRIAFNQGAGVVVNNSGGGPGPEAASQALSGNTVRANSIFANGGLGIDLSGDGISFNDAGDVDGLQNFPALTEVRHGGRRIDITGTLDSAPDTTYTLDFYASRASDPSGFGEGERYLGSATVSTDGNGHGSFDVLLDGKVRLDEAIAATATDPSGNTSEFSFALAGHAAVRVRNGRLLIQGNGAAIRIAAGANGAGAFQVTEGDRTETFTGITGGIGIDDQGGASEVFLDGSVTPLFVTGGIEMHMGSRSAGVTMDQVTVQGPTALDRPGGTSVITLRDVTFGDGLIVHAGTGDEVVSFQNVSVAGELDLHTGSGADIISLVDSTFSGPVLIDTGGGDDLAIIEGTSFGGAASINMGVGDDRLFLLSVTAGGLLSQDGGAGNDLLFTADLTTAQQQVLNFETVQTF